MSDKVLLREAMDKFHERYPSIALPLVDVSCSEYVLSIMLDGMVEKTGAGNVANDYFSRVNPLGFNALDDRCRILIAILKGDRPIKQSS